LKRAGVKLVEYEMWRYRYIVLFMISLIISVFILTSSQIAMILKNASEWGYLGAFVTGSFYTYSLSSPPAAAVFFELSHGLNPFIAAGLGGLGAMLGDLIIFKFIKTDILPEARLLAKDLKLPRIRSRKVLHLFHKIAPFFAGFIIASPFPDEIGAALFGAIEYDTKKFMIVSWVCNTAGLLAIALLGHLF
jgi:uncharacterized membrane protein YdjX (TVP38/TMEM64 family)